jgi:ribosomal protein S8
MVINEVPGKIMKHFVIMTNQLQKSISRSNLTCMVPSTKYNQQILNLLQINGFINGFKILDNTKQIIVYFKFVNNANVIKRIFRFKRFDRS